MSKRELDEPADRPEQKRDEENDMGEFEDPFEDEMESEDEGVVVDAAENGEMEIEEEEDDEEEEEENEPVTEAYVPKAKELREGQTLVPDQSAYHMLHRMNVAWPCLSFDFLRDHLGNQRQAFPHTAYLVAGTQADVAKNNEVLVMKASSMHRTSKDDDLSDDDDDDDEDVDEDAVLEYRSIPTLGGVNRVRCAPTSTPTSDLEPCLDPYPVAVWSETGKVPIFDARPSFNTLQTPGSTFDKKRAHTPLYTVEAHRGVEGYAMDWGGLLGGGSSGKGGHLRLVTGDIHSKIFLTSSNNTGFTTNPTPFESHTSSVEDLQWSPSEPTVFASCSADRSIRIWDVRVKSRKSALAMEDAHTQDVNVISWNHGTQYLLLSGGDEGALNVWDMRNLQSKQKASPVAHFEWHQGPISSVEWNRDEDSIFAASGLDDQVTLWDLAVERDEDEDASQLPKGPNGEPVPSQLLFCHHGASEIKEVHWHPQIPGMLGSTSADGFHFFKTISV
ncbi:Ribosome assembly protein rrb1 [Malassezia psittaci]|uniref:Glutamate-rich WD repeat-containing protein 1 n=1 Tax=Malassezia psittaci TaxID=1821823 RepID=A0AAF0F3N1_9BASI|nr:Ribosome assembly protein rrb1 [Malassezia psittaci]